MGKRFNKTTAPVNIYTKTQSFKDWEWISTSVANIYIPKRETITVYNFSLFFNRSKTIPKSLSAKKF
ncbi:hypothetical protein [Geobacillus vulcani]|uniref:hypothetical protein n=1 Tax=Geobacillus vulcani TaxID=135517 RepID=UPI001ED9BF71|nr:hypothetical protein [Geobacillus vulcani]